MNRTDYLMHLAAGKAYGRESTCGPPDKPKQKYNSENTSMRAAKRMSERLGRELEAYPCCWCHYWHIGRELTAAERDQFT